MQEPPELDPYLQRLKRLQSQLQPHQVALLCQPSDMCYFTGLQVITQNEREAFLIVSPTSSHLFVAAFTPLPAFLENRHDLAHLSVTHSLQSYGIIAAIQKCFEDDAQKTILFDEQHFFMAEANEVKKGLEASSSSQIEYGALDRGFIWKLRQQKDELELGIMRQAAQIVSQALAETLSSLQEGETEQDVAYRLDNRMHQLGASGPAFPTIVAFGEHAALPHHQPGKTLLTPETPVLIDCGACVDRYNSDITRTVWFGHQPTEEFLSIEKIVKDAYQSGKNYLTQGAKAAENFSAAALDKIVRDSIEKEGYGKSFIHTTGHGIGLEVHEPPSLYVTNTMNLLENMVVTIEPGIYLPGRLGYRYENTLLITSQGAQELTQ